MKEYTVEELKRMKNSPQWPYRSAVAYRGYFLDELKNDPNEAVRVIVARQGYALGELVNDPVERVREEALKHL